MRNVLDKSCRENQNTHFMFNNFFENRAVYEIMSKNMVEPERSQMTNDACAHREECNSCFSTALVVSRTRVGITLIRTSPVLLCAPHT